MGCYRSCGPKLLSISLCLVKEDFIQTSLWKYEKRVITFFTLQNSLCSVRSPGGKHSVISISLVPTTPTKVKGQWSRTGVRTRQEASLSRRKMYGPSYVSTLATAQSETVETEVVAGPPHSGTDTLGSGLSGPLVPEALCPPVSCSALRGKSLRMTSGSWAVFHWCISSRHCLYLPACLFSLEKAAED